MKKIYSIVLAALLCCLWTTAVAEARALPYSYGFEDYNLATDGWTTYFGTSLTNNNKECAIVGAAKKTGSYGFRFSSYNTSGANAQYLISPEFDAPNGIVVAFVYAASNTSGTEKFKVGYSTTDTEVTSFTFGDEISTKSTSWQTYENVFPAGTKYVAVYYYSNYQYRLYVDDFTFEAPSSCPKPSGLAISNVIYNGATATWTAGGEETKWELQYSTDQEEWIVANDGNAIENKPTFDLTGLTAGTKYYARVRGICAVGDTSSFCDVQNFTPDYVAPSNVAVNAITTTGATISWTANSGEKAWTLQYKKSADSQWTGAAVETTPSYELTGLVAATNYDVRIVAGTKTSTTVSFQTNCEAFNAPYKWAFEDQTANAIPTCWDNSGSTTATLSSSDAYGIWGVYSYSGNKSIRLYNSYVKTGTALINTPSIVLPASPAQELTFVYSHRASCGDFIVKISTDGGANFAALESYSRTATNSTYDPGTFEEAAISLADYANKTVILQFFATADYDAGAIFVDDVDIHAASSCPTPKNVAVSNITDHTASVAWTEKGEATAWKLQTSTDGENWGEEIAANANPFTLTGLDASTTYYVRVKAVCSESESSEWSDASAAFTTKCEAKALPFEEGFEEGLSECWEKTNQWSTYAYSSGHNSSTSMRYTTGSNGDLTLPAIAINDDAQFSFWHQSSYVSCAVYVNAISDENKLGTYSTSSSWKKDSIDLSAYKGQTITLIIRANTVSGTRYLYIDDVAVDYAPVAVPTALAVEATDGGAAITWESEEGSSWNLRYREVSEQEADWTLVSGLTEKTKTLTGLTNGTTYEVQVQAVASANRKSDWTESVEFTPVACAAVTEVSFSGATYNSVTVSWTASAAGTWSLRYKEADGEWTTVSPIAEQTKTLTSLTTGKAYTVEVKATCAGDDAWKAAETTFTPVYTAPAGVAVASITDVTATASWNAVADAPNGYLYTVVLKDATVDWSKARVADGLSVELSGLEALTAYDLHVAAVYGEHREPAAAVSFTTIAIAPKNLAQVGESTTSAATFAWEAQGAATQWQWSLDGENWSEPISALTVTADELNAGTAYTFYVRSYYSEAAQSAAVSLPFTTECAVAALPFAQDFGTVDGTKPTCWTIANWGTSANSWYTYTDYAKTGYALRYNARTLSSADAVTPSIEITDAAELKFYIKNSVGNNSAKVECKVLVNDGTETTELADITTRYTAATLQTIDLSAFAGKTITIIFRGMGYDTSGSPYLWIDDVTVTFKPVAVPTALAAEATAEGAVVTWASEEGSSWNLRYREVSEQEADWTLVSGLTEKSKELTGLTQGKEYEVQVQAVASAHRLSEWTTSATFTPQSCPNVTVVSFGAATYNSVVVSWTTEGAGTWNVRYKAGEGEWTLIENIAALTTTLTGLTTNAVYTVQVKPACGDDNTWVAAEAFTPVYTQPANVAVADITDIVASASWNAVADAPNGYLYIAVLKGATVDWNEARATDEPKAALTGLQALTEYDLHVAAVYGEHLEAAAVSFTTIAIAPKNLEQVGESTTSAATFAWEAQGAATRWQWSLDGENWSEPISVLTATADELNAGTAYTFYVRSYYDNEAVSEAISLAFTTECAVVALPFAEDFEAEGLPVCWASDDWSATVAAGKWARDNSYSRSGYAIRFNAKTTASAAITTPAILLSDEADALLTFYIRNSYGSSSSPDYIGGKVVVADVADATNAVEAEFIHSSEGNLGEQTVDLALLRGKTVTVTFAANGVGTSVSGNPALYIDDVSVTLKQTDPSAIDRTGIESQARKLIENDRVVIIRNGVKYSAQGWVLQ